MKLKTRSVTILTDDEVALVSGGTITFPFRYTSDCGVTEYVCQTYTETLDCYSRECDPYETQNNCDDTNACESDACNTETSGCPTYTDACNSYTDACTYTLRCGGGGTIP